VRFAASFHDSFGFIYTVHKLEIIYADNCFDIGGIAPVYNILGSKQVSCGNGNCA
jgi:hypothetical protein